LHRSSLIWLASISIGLIVLYLLGIFVRGHYGIAVSVHNTSGQPLQGLGIKVEPSGKAYELGGLPDKELARVFVQPRTESHITLQYLDRNVPHIETVVAI